MPAANENTRIHEMFHTAYSWITKSGIASRLCSISHSGWYLLSLREILRSYNTMDAFAVLSLKILLAILNAIPLRLRLGILTGIVRLAFVLLPKLKRVSRENLKIAFPEQSEEWREAVLHRSYGSLARTIVDFARMPTLDAQWVSEHVECPILDRYKALHAEGRKSGLLIATGHLGSFELLAHCSPMYGYPLNFVIRNSKLPKVDAWWRSLREANGNKVISRKGAIKEVISRLQKGEDVGILFDQNVTINHATFVDWFGTKAATTRAVALAALRTRARVMVASVRYLGDERYRIEAEEFSFDSIYDDSARTSDEKVVDITATLANSYVEMIRRSPHEWFWMHRRWRTRPDDATSTEQSE